MSIELPERIKPYIDIAIEWAQERRDIRAILVAGSLAREQNPGDEWADIDLEIYITDYNAYFAEGKFIPQFGEVWVKVFTTTPDSDPQHLVVFAGGQKVDFTFFPVGLLTQQTEKQFLFDSQQRGYKVLVDKDKLASQLPLPTTGNAPFQRPSQDKFHTMVSEFWYGAQYLAKQLRRDNLWVAKEADMRLKPALFKMVEWQAQARNKWQHNTWHGGHFMKSWAAPETWRGLHKTFGHFDQVDSWQALFGTMKLFRMLAVEVAENLKYDYLHEMDDALTGYIYDLFDDFMAQRQTP